VALTAKCLVISAEVAAYQQVEHPLTHGHNALVVQDPRSVEQIVRALEGPVVDRDFARRLGDAARMAFRAPSDAAALAWASRFLDVIPISSTRPVTLARFQAELLQLYARPDPAGGEWRGSEASVRDLEPGLTAAERAALATLSKSDAVQEFTKSLRSKQWAYFERRFDSAFQSRPAMRDHARTWFLLSWSLPDARLYDQVAIFAHALTDLGKSHLSGGERERFESHVALAEARAQALLLPVTQVSSRPAPRAAVSADDWVAVAQMAVLKCLPADIFSKAGASSDVKPAYVAVVAEEERLATRVIRISRSVYAVLTALTEPCSVSDVSAQMNREVAQRRADHAAGAALGAITRLVSAGVLEVVGPPHSSR
jgi:hypothetical protein